MVAIENLTPNIFDPAILPSAKRIQKLLLPGSDCAMHSVMSLERAGLEQYIAAKFRAVYGAELSEFLPQLMGLKCHGRFSAAVGIRHGSHEPLFVEQYLDQPIEQTMLQRLQNRINRNDIAEIGNLVSNWRGASQLLFVLLVGALHKAGFKWVVFTATEEVEHLIEKARFSPITICKADPERLGEERAKWGTYYDTNPHVLAGDLDGALQHVLENRLLSFVYESYADTIDVLALQLSSQR